MIQVHQAVREVQHLEQVAGTQIVELKAICEEYSGNLTIIHGFHVPDVVICRLVCKVQSVVSWFLVGRKSSTFTLFLPGYAMTVLLHLITPVTAVKP
jgi:hypothetical protein